MADPDDAMQIPEEIKAMNFEDALVALEEIGNGVLVAFRNAGFPGGAAK